jgi:hypothetical protein
MRRKPRTSSQNNIPEEQVKTRSASGITKKKARDPANQAAPVIPKRTSKVSTQKRSKTQQQNALEASQTTVLCLSG